MADPYFDDSDWFNQQATTAPPPEVRSGVDPAEVAEAAARSSQGYNAGLDWAAFASQPYGGQAPVGFRQEKWGDPTFHSPKYDVSRIIAKYGHSADGLRAALPEIQQLFPQARLVSGDKIYLSPEWGTIDVIHDVGGKNEPGWITENEARRNAAMRSGGGGGGFGGGGGGSAGQPVGLGTFAAGSLMGLAAKTLPESPGFQFRISEGQKALERSAASRGTLLSGGTLKSLERYAQGTAADEYAAQYARLFGERQQGFNEYLANRQQTLAEKLGYGNLNLQTTLGLGNLALGQRSQGFDEIYRTAALGQNAATTAGNNAATFGNLFGNLNAGQSQAVSDLITDIGNARAAGGVGAGNAIQQAISQGLTMAQIYQIIGRYGL